MALFILIFLTVFLGALCAIAFVEWMKRPRLSLRIGERQDLSYALGTRPFDRMLVLNLTVRNEKPFPLFFWWLDRRPAVQCHGQITFHYLDWQPIFDRPMSIRFVDAPEPVGFVNEAHGQSCPACRWLMDRMRRKDIRAGDEEAFSVVARFDQDDDCYGWSDENYGSLPQWRDPAWRIAEEQFLITATIRSGGRSCSTRYRIVNNAKAGLFLIDHL